MSIIGTTLLDALTVATRSHANQIREAPPYLLYLVHPIHMAQILEKEAGVTDEVVLRAALLHDVLGRTKTTRQDLERQFGAEVTDVVLEVTDDRSLPTEARMRRQIVLARTMSERARLVKLADKIDNLRSFRNEGVPTGWDVKTVQGYFVWAKRVVSQMPQTNEILQRLFEEVLGLSFSHNGVMHPCLPDELDEKEALAGYFNFLGKTEMN